jgi:hypothetical protein
MASTMLAATVLLLLASSAVGVERAFTVTWDKGVGATASSAGISGRAGLCDWGAFFCV